MQRTVGQLTEKRMVIAVCGQHPRDLLEHAFLHTEKVGESHILWPHTADFRHLHVCGRGIGQFWLHILAIVLRQVAQETLHAIDVTHITLGVGLEADARVEQVGEMILVVVVVISSARALTAEEKAFPTPKETSACFSW